MNRAQQIAQRALSHPDGNVRCYADWYLEYSVGRFRHGIKRNRHWAAVYATKLRKALLAKPYGIY